MEIIPSIDLKDGKCVRLYQGDYRQVTIYGDDPVTIAQGWAETGAPRLHVVDLDGSREGWLVNLAVVHRICVALGIPVQCAGGVRSVEDAHALADAGADRIVVGTAAVADPDLVRHLVEGFGERLVVAVDARDGLVATRGWLETSARSAIEVAREMAASGVGRLLYTDISRDGTLTAPNFEGTARLMAALRAAGPSPASSASPPRGEGSRGPVPLSPPGTTGNEGGGRPRPPAVIASGGVASVEHLRRLATLGVEGAIVGRALYTGHVRLAEALAAVKDLTC